MEGSDGFQLLHPATVMEAMLEGCNHNNYFKNVYCLTLCTVKPLDTNHVRQAFVHLFRKVPTLRLCFRRRGGQLWACYMNREEIDFEVVDSQDVTAQEVTEELGNYNYNSTEGPLWCARLLTKEKDAICSREELKTTFPYTCSLVLANHHANADGTTCTQTIDFFMQILNDIIAGKEIDDTVEMREYKGAKEFDDMLNAQDKKLEEDPERLEALLREFRVGYLKQPIICRALPPIEGVPFKTRFLHTVLDLDTTSRFIKKCKEHNITVNSGFVALIAVSLVDFCLEAGVAEDEYTFKAANSINMRRYMPKYMADVLGAHTSLLIHTIVTPARWQSCFWDYAKKVHREFYKDLEAEPIIMHCLGRRIFYNCDGFREAYSKPHPPQFDYIAATMNNIDIRIPTDGDHARLGHVIRFTSNAYDPVMHMYHSFRGRFHYTLTYSVNLLTTETAQKMMDLLLKNLYSQL